MSVIGSSNSTLKIEKIAVFDEPWALTFINQNDLLVSTKKGKLWLVEKGGTKSAIEGLPEITYGGQGGLGDILPHPNFKQNNLLYLSGLPHTKVASSEIINKVVELVEAKVKEKTN